MSLGMCTLAFWYGAAIRSWSSFKVLRELESSPKAAEDLKELLQFWTIFAVVALFDAYLEIFVSWVPLYPLAKLFFLWYIITPSTKGSQVVFENFIEPKFEEKLFWLEKTFLVDVLASFVELDWMYEHLTIQLRSRLETVSENQLEVLQREVQALVSSIEGEIALRKDRKVLMLKEEDYELVQKGSRTPSPQTPPSQVMPSQVMNVISAAIASIESKSSHQTPRTTPPATSFQPSYYPSRGVHYPPVVQVNLEEEEDVQDATLRSLEMDESLSSTPEERASPLPEDKGSSSLLSPDSLLHSPFQIFARRFSWMSPRWPSSQQQTEHESTEEREKEEEEEEVGPITRSRARQKRLVERQSSSSIEFGETVVLRRRTSRRTSSQES